ncbi:HelD family protein [Cellulomonas endophytica]|uniref:HelD family protein n=1 Tax=Cellulomonas endophytica TaxID=2494735 RepID=UPI0010104155|nr:UvrD-helicase domain-containing protein [Cellulomonas endophytica]
MGVGTDTAAERRVEQSYFDRAVDVRERKRADRAAGFAAVGDAKARSSMAANARRDTTLGSPDDAPALVRIDVQGGEAVYAGLHALLDEQQDMLVYSWQTPYVMQLREATATEPGTVVRRRTFTCDGTRIRRFDDLVLAEIARKVAELEDPEWEATRSDVLLEDTLSRSRTPEMQQIVQTLQATQSKVIRRPARSLTVVQGGPGTGKTAVALHRVSWLLHNHREVRPDDVLVVGPTRTFTRYVRQVLPELGDADVVQTDVIGMLDVSVRASGREASESARLKGDARMMDVLARALEQRVRVPTGQQRLRVRNQRWPLVVERALLEEVVRPHVSAPYLVGRARFRTALQQRLSVLTAAELKARGVGSRGDAGQLLDQVEVEALTDKIWPQTTTHAFLRELYASTERLRQAANGLLGAAEVEMLRRAPGTKLADVAWTKEDLVLLDHLADAMGGGTTKTFSHVVVDEAQDLSPMQLDALRRRSRDGAMTLVGDVAQSTGVWARASWDDVLDLLSSPLPREVVELEFGYRVPSSVMEVAARLLPFIAPGLGAPKVLRDVPDAVGVHPAQDLGDLAERVAALVRDHAGRGRFVGVVCPDQCRDALTSALRAHDIRWADADGGGLSNGINLVSPVVAKGLEFDSVVVVEPRTIVESGPEGLRMLYIALTRATRSLDLVHVEGSLPPELGLPAARATTVVEEGGPGAAAATAGAQPEDVEMVAPAVLPAGAASSHLLSTDRRGQMVRFAAEQVVADLRSTVAPALWDDVLQAAKELLAE